jgi:hypothetical protein
MSLEATHLRFSLALCADLGAGDMEKYYAGTLYPDTRYTTGLNRRLTHNFSDFLASEPPDDFRKGWLSHLLADRIFKEMLEDKFPDLVLTEDSAQRWAAINGIKIIQDQQDAGAFDLQELLPHLDYYELHFREDERQVIRFHELVRSIYGGKSRITVEDYIPFWKELGVTPAQLALLRKKLIELYADAELIVRIKDNFADGMDLYRQRYRPAVRALDLRTLVKSDA